MFQGLLYKKRRRSSTPPGKKSLIPLFFPVQKTWHSVIVRSHILRLGNGAEAARMPGYLPVIVKHGLVSLLLSVLESLSASVRRLLRSRRLERPGLLWHSLLRSLALLIAEAGLERT